MAGDLKKKVLKGAVIYGGIGLVFGGLRLVDTLMWKAAFKRITKVTPPPYALLQAVGRDTVLWPLALANYVRRREGVPVVRFLIKPPKIPDDVFLLSGIEASWTTKELQWRR